MRKNYTSRTLFNQSKRKKKRKPNHKSKKYREYLKRQRAKAARIKARKQRHRRKHPKKESYHGFFIIFARYIIARIHLREKIESCIYHKKKPNSTFSIVDMIIGLIGLIVLGLPRIYKVAKYQQDKLLARALGLDRFFSGSTAYRFLKAFGFLTMCRYLQKANAKMISDLLQADKLIVVDGDTSTVRSYPNNKEGSCKGYNKLRPGRPCFQAIAYFANGFCVKSQIVEGNQVPVDTLTLITDLREVRRLCGRIDWIRLDAGYASKAELRGLDDFSCVGHSREKARFIVNVGSKGIGAQEAIRLSQYRTWKRMKKGVFIQEFRNMQVYHGYEKRHRLILVKEYCEDRGKWRFYTLVTNETAIDAVELYHFYCNRQVIEDFFDDIKNSYSLQPLPCSKLLGNSLYFNIICLTFNVLILFRLEVLRKKDHWLQLKTFQFKYSCFDIIWDGAVLYIHRSNPDYRVILMTLQRLKKFVALEYQLCG